MQQVVGLEAQGSRAFCVVERQVRLGKLERRLHAEPRQRPGDHRPEPLCDDESFPRTRPLPAGEREPRLRCIQDRRDDVFAGFRVADEAARERELRVGRVEVPALEREQREL